MEVKTGYLYHIKDEFFDKLKNKGLMINHENGHSRPSYLAIKDKNILWFIPLSTNVDKYKKIIEQKNKKYKSCKTILIKRIGDIDSVILIQNAFPTCEKYVNNIHKRDNKIVKISDAVKREIIEDLNYVLELKKSGLNLFFTDIDFIEKFVKEELKNN